jgi:hypothetical protein
MRDFKSLYKEYARDLPETLKYENNYTLGIHLGIIDGKYIDINDVLKEPDMPYKEVIKDLGSALLFPTLASDNDILSVQLMSLEPENRKRLLLGNKEVPLFIQYLSPSFRYGEPIILVEGLGDLIGLKLINPEYNIICMNTSQVNDKLKELLKALTDKLILIPDNDKAGEIGIRVSQNKVKDFATLKVIKQYEGLKDTGDIVKLTREYLQDTSDSKLKQELNNIMTYYETMINLNVE